MRPCSTDTKSVTATDPHLSSSKVLWFENAPSYSEFFDRCLSPNRPCMLPTALVQEWDVVKNRLWQKRDLHGQIAEVDWDYLVEKYGDHVSPVVVSRTTGDEDRLDMTIKEAVSLLRTFKDEKGDPDIESVYIKDWHLIRQLCPDEPHPYTVPGIFADDWMNNIALDGTTASDVSDDDFKFVYAGTKGSRTALHRDVYTSYSWSTNVVGRKIWYLFPPSVIPHLRRFPKVQTSQLIPDIEMLRKIVSTPSTTKDYPELLLAWRQVQIVTQEQGQTIFVPSNWYHQVENLDDCLSINRNWCNSVNIPSLYRSIKQELTHVEESLSDVKQILQQQCKSIKEQSSNDRNERTSTDSVPLSARSVAWQFEFSDLVQDVAIKDAGWAWLAFWNMIQHNLRSPPGQPSTRPSSMWVKSRILPLIDDFETSSHTQYLDDKIVTAAKECRNLLDKL